MDAGFQLPLVVRYGVSVLLFYQTRSVSRKKFIVSENILKGKSFKIIRFGNTQETDVSVPATPERKLPAGFP